MKLEAAVFGNLHKFMENQKKAAELAVTLGILEITDKVKNDLRKQVINASLGEKLARSWQSKVYPKGKKSINAAGFVYCKATKIIRAFNEGVTIKSKHGLFLAIPTENAPKRGSYGKRISPETFPEHLLGKLRFVYRPGKISLLVVDNLRESNGKRRGYRKASLSGLRKGNGLASVVMFFLIPQIKLTKKLDYKIVLKNAPIGIASYNT